MQEEIERQKAALFDKTKRKETIEVSGKHFFFPIKIDITKSCLLFENQNN